MSLFSREPKWIELEDCRLPWWTVGDGPDVVLVHGWPLDARTWRGVLPALAQHFTCHLIDLPGAGRSEWNERTRVGLAENCVTLQRAIDHMGLREYGLVAHDSGAFFARVVAARDKRVFGLVLGNTEIPGHRPWQVKAYVLGTKVPGGTALFRLMLRSRWARRLPLILGSCFHDMDVADAEFKTLFIDPLIHSDEAMAGQMLLAEHLDFTVVDQLFETHPQIQAPVQLLWGAGDTFFPLKMVEEMMSQFGGETELHVFDPGKLFIHEEYADRFGELADAFLLRCAQRSRLSLSARASVS